MQAADFFRYHGLGNDYLVIDPAFCDTPMTEENIRLICHRNFGIGSDGILHGPLKGYGEGGKQAEHSADEALYFRIWNPDGSEAEKSGNGIRIFAQYLLDQGYVRGPEFSLETLGGKVHIKVIDEKEHLLKVDMGYATLHAAEIPVDVEKLSSHNTNEHGEVVALTLNAGKRDFTVSCVSIGNPHCVVMDGGGRQEISAEEANIYGPLIENHPAFPNRTNVQFLKVLDRNSVQIEIWERGAGYTQASGSSSCAAATAAWRSGLVDSPVRVLMPGGEFTIVIKAVDGGSGSEQHPDNKWQHACARLELTGPVAGVCQGMFLPDFKHRLKGH
ncbi:diaminopimelate epimerase [Candidatus Haliotispira prima]|uniref:Diaminopimelate epimerase n=1 Tax=Candidatus Haliotispira prima TaxID=3034016 RepID=A0ABY8MHM5_9SPIO|nr:diaminopimelate epimerase [Candidatus Haliotispira prima]